MDTQTLGEKKFRPVSHSHTQSRWRMGNFYIPYGQHNTWYNQL